MMFRELAVVVTLTLIFSAGVSVLFVRTILDMFELMINGEIRHKKN